MHPATIQDTSYVLALDLLLAIKIRRKKQTTAEKFADRTPFDIDFRQNTTKIPNFHQ